MRLVTTGGSHGSQGSMERNFVDVAEHKGEDAQRGVIAGVRAARGYIWGLA